MEKGIMCNKTDKGYGFIRSSTGERIFVHIKNVDPEVYVRLAKGSKVLFDYEETYKGKSATKVILDEPENTSGKKLIFQRSR